MFFTTYDAHIIAASADTPSYNFGLTATATPSTGDMQIMIVATDEVLTGTIFAYAAVCQDSIPAFFGDANYVVQEMFVFPLDLAYPDTLDTVITFSHTLPVDDIRAVVFIQNMDTKKVLGAATTHFEEAE